MPATPITTSAVVTTQADLLLGWSLAETSGSLPANIEIHDAGARTRMIASINLDPGESTAFSLGAPLQLTGGGSIYAYVTGSIEGGIWWA